jgi:6-pyruvoyltetrahydropterin/6-carboxytetrahydropterin synthase
MTKAAFAKIRDGLQDVLEEVEMLPPRITARRSHEFCYGHRVVGHEGKCRQLHGHGGVVHFECSAPQLDGIGRVIDFGVIKARLCAWLEHSWDHRMLIWDQDPWLEALQAVDEAVVTVPFNPTAENLAHYLLTVVGPQLLEGTGVKLVRVQFEETRKCSAVVER